MQLYKSRSHYLFVDGEHCLWCGRFDGVLEAKPCSSIKDLKTLDYLCSLEGIVGKVQIFPDSEPKLLIILAKSVSAVIAAEHEVYRIDRIGILNLSPTDPVEGDRLLFSGKHAGDLSSSGSTENLSESNLILMNRGVQKTLKTLRQATHFNLGMKSNRKDKSERDKLERRILEDICKMFNDSQSFYYSITWDLTNCMQNLFALRGKNGPVSGKKRLSWRLADERFFWNGGLWKDLLTTSGGINAENDHWIHPIVQGYIQMENMVIDLNTFDSGGQLHSPVGEYIAPMCCRVILISRRSIFRAGTRYKRRGIDDKGNVANYVETEQILEIMGHCLSFVQLRGSIPVYWSQPGMRYRPAPRLDRDLDECHLAFAQHFKGQLDLYKHLTIINLVEQTGREKILADAYLREILNYDSENLVYVSFDFHEYCRGLRLENIATLIQSLQDVFQGMRFFWSKSLAFKSGDDHIMCQQRSVFRVNCVDCLDRTNVIQASLARFVLESQLRKMGLLLPDIAFPVECKQVLQMMWANNGDAISRQYAGTAALKGDVTRTGERNFAGLMKDGYTSANRYYLNQFKDAYRQAAVDASLGRFFQEESILVPGVSSTTIDPTEFERVKQLVDDCKRILIPETEVALGGWPVIDADSSTGDQARQDMDAVLLLSTQAYYVGEYSDESDMLVGYQRVPLGDVDSIEIGPEPAMFRAKKVILRINYHIGADPGYCHQMRTAGLRFFNNMIMPVVTEDESIEMLRSVGESFRMALESQHDRIIPVMFGRMQRKLNKIPPKEIAPVDSAGGIFTAAPVVPLVPKPHLGDVLSAVKSKLSDLNPMHRLHLSSRSAASLYSKETDKVVPSISIQSPASSTTTSESGSTTGSADDLFDENGTAMDRKITDDVLDSCGIIMNSMPTDQSTSQEGSGQAGDKLRSMSIPNSNQLSTVKQRQMSRSSDALDETPTVANSPLVLSASPSMKEFSGDSSDNFGKQHGSFVLGTDNDKDKSDMNRRSHDVASGKVPVSPSLNRHRTDYQESKSKRTCRTKIIEL